MLPFDIALLRGIAYRPTRTARQFDPESCASSDRRPAADAARENPHDDSPLFQLLDIHAAYRDRSQQDRHFSRAVRLFEEIQGAPRRRPRKGAEAVQEVVAEPALSNLHEVETGVVVDLFLSLRDVKAYKGMIELLQSHAAAAATGAHHARAISALRSIAKAARRRRKRCSRR